MTVIQNIEVIQAYVEDARDAIAALTQQLSGQQATDGQAIYETLVQAASKVGDVKAQAMGIDTVVGSISQPET